MSDALDKYALTGLLTVASGIQLTNFAKAVGKCRGRVGLKYPETNGPEEFNRYFRAQANCLEFYPVAIGTFWVSSVFAHPVPASVLFSGYMIGRQQYFKGYCESPEKRLPGFKLSVRCLIGMAILALVGTGNRLGRHFLGVDLAKIVCDHLPSIKGN